MGHALSDEARARKNAYLREWRKKNPDKVKEISNRYWERKAEQSAKISKEEE